MLPADDTPALLTIREAAHLLRRHPDTVAKWTRTGYLPSVVVGQGKFIRRDDLEALLATSPGGRALIDARLAEGRPVLTEAQLDVVRRAIDAALAALGSARTARGEVGLAKRRAE